MTATNRERGESPVVNGIVHQLNALAAHDREHALGVARLMIEAAAHWQMSHGGDTGAIIARSIDDLESVVHAISTHPEKRAA